MTTLHAGGKFGGEGYKVSGGLHGVGASVVNALSEWLELEIRREGHVWSQRYERGFPKGALTKDRKLKKGEGTGTIVSFSPTPRSLPRPRTLFRHPEPLVPRVGFPQQGTQDPARRRAGRRQGRHVPVRGRHKGLRGAHQRGEGPRPQDYLLPRARGGGGTWRSRCSGTAASRTPSSRSPTTSTRTKAGRTSPVSGRRCRGRSTPTPGRRVFSRRKRRALPATTSGKVGRGHLGQAAGAPVRGADQDQAREHGGQGPRRERDQPLSCRVPGGAAW